MENQRRLRLFYYVFLFFGSFTGFISILVEEVCSTEAAVLFEKSLGSIRATVLDSTTAPVIAIDDYDAWGYPLATRTKAIPNAYLQGASKIKFTGKERDDEFGINLDYSGARSYDWLTGRWISVDPLALKYPSLSPYAYAANNPVIFYDPDGRSVWTKIAKVAVKLVKTGSAAAAFADNVSDVKTLFSSDASVGARGLAAVSLASEFLPVSIGDVKDVAKVVDKAVDFVKGADNAGDAVKTLENVGEVAQEGIAEGTKVYRVWGDKSGAWGKSWTATNPGEVENFRDAAGLPNQNTGRFVSEGVITDMKGIKTKAATPLHGNKGGLPEVVIPDPEKQVKLERVSGVNPKQ